MYIYIEIYKNIDTVSNPLYIYTHKIDTENKHTFEQFEVQKDVFWQTNVCYAQVPQ